MLPDGIPEGAGMEVREHPIPCAEERPLIHNSNKATPVGIIAYCYLTVRVFSIFIAVCETLHTAF